MVKLEVRNGKIETSMCQENYPIYEELGQGINQLLIDFQVELIKRGTPREVVRNAYCEIMSTLMARNEENLQKALNSGSPFLS